ncbi:AAA family ATPase [Thermodesulfovibrionales bacterium]|nr:AAA family ATPase [Thermodesulfovibrionales bacterium]MCL0061291.1 AAA family ATPase [Thermodesulfovibrionales bacterium]MCL0074539.1 AAA family ATPase [Thermodesulfovibrionales bacterium]
MTNYKSFFGFTKEPFLQGIKTEQLYRSAALEASTERFLYAVELGAVSVITGEVGSGKSTALRYASGKLHPSEYRIISVIASTGSALEILKQICIGLGVERKSTSISALLKTIRSILMEISQRKQTPVLVIDEANLMRLEVFAQLHTIGQFDMDSKAIMPMTLSGQNNLLDKLMYHTSRPLASRVVGRSHFEGLKLNDMRGYIKHHLEIAGISEFIFSDEALLAIHQGSGGLLRRANILAKGSLIAATKEKCHLVSAEHARIASTEII